MDEISVETIIPSQLGMKTSEEVIALSKSYDCPRIQRVGNILTTYNWMPCVWQELDRYTGNNLQGRVPRGWINGEHDLREDVSLWVKVAEMGAVLERE